jgi:hypothetical protein
VRKTLASGVDPSHARKAHAATHAEHAANSFERIAREWFSKVEPSWVPAHSIKVISRLENDVFPWIGACQ